MMAQHSPRYNFMVPAPVQLGRYWSAFLLISSLLLAWVAQSIVWSPILVLFAIGGVFGLLHPAEAGWYVDELTATAKNAGLDVPEAACRWLRLHGLAYDHRPAV